MTQNHESILDFIEPDQYIRQLFKLFFKDHEDYLNANALVDKFMNKFRMEYPRKMHESYNANVVANLIALAHEIFQQHLQKNALEHSTIEMVLK